MVSPKRKTKKDIVKKTTVKGIAGKEMTETEPEKNIKNEIQLKSPIIVKKLAEALGKKTSGTNKKIDGEKCSCFY